MKKLLLVSLLALVLPAAARSAACGPLTCAPSQFSVGGPLMGPYAVALKGKYAYVTTHTTEAGAGEVVRIALPDGDGDD